jgi:hypothetical protein
MLNLNKNISAILGDTRPGLRFWILQAASFCVGVVLPIFLMSNPGDFAHRLDSGPRLGLIFFLIFCPFGWAVFHSVACLSASRHLKAYWAVLLIRCYSLLPIAIAAQLAWQWIVPSEGFKPKGRQVNAKSALARFFDAELACQAKTSHLCTSLEEFRLEDPEAKSFYAFLAINCTTTPVLPLLIEPKAWKISEQNRQPALNYLKQLDAQAACRGHEQGFVLYAAGRIELNGPLEKFDVWTVDEKKQLHNLIEGY